MRRVIALALALAFALPLGAFAAPAAAAQGPVPQLSVPVTETARWNYSGRIDQVAYSPDGRHLAVAIDGGVVEVLNATTFALENTLAPQGAWMSASSISWGPNSDKLGVGYEGGEVVVWRIPSGTIVWPKGGLNYEVRGVSWSPDGRYLAAGIVHSILIYWHQDGYLNATIPLDYGGSQPAGLSWSPDSDYIAVGQQALSPAGAIVAVFDAASWGKSLGWRWLGLDMDNVAFEGRGRFLAVQLGHTRAEVWEVRNWTLHTNLTTVSGLEQFAWSADGSRLVTLETEPSAFGNETQDLGGFEVLHLGGGSGNSSAMGVSPDGRVVAIGYDDGTVQVLTVGGERLFDDLTPLRGTTGDPLTFSVRSTAAGTVRVTLNDAQGGRSTTADLTFAAGRHTLTFVVPPDWEGTMLYSFSQPSTGASSPERIIRVTDNDAPTVTSWGFSRGGSAGELGTATATVADNVRVTTASMLLAVDGTAAAAATAGANQTLSFSLTATVTEANRSVRIEVRGVDAAGNGGLLFEISLDLDDLAAPIFGADLSAPGTAGGRIQLGTIAVDARGPPTVNVTWRELTSDAEGPWSSFTFGVPPPGFNNFLTTFPLGRNTVAVEYSFAARDEAGNTNGTAVRVQPVLDREPPEVVADLSDRDALQGDLMHLGVIARDNIGISSVVALVQEDGGTTAQVPLTPWLEYGEGAFEGNFTVGTDSDAVAYSFLVTDEEGNTVSSGRRELFVKDNDPPEMHLAEAILRVAAGSPFTLHVDASDRSDVGNLTVFYRRAGEQSYLQEEFTADVRGGTTVKTARFGFSLAEIHAETAHDGRAVEMYFFTLDGARNGGYLGSAGDPIRVIVLDGAPPVARIEAAGEFVVGSSVSFDGGSSSDDLGIVAFDWTIDDQPAGNRSAIAWRVVSAGTHTVKLTVTDGANNTQTQTLHITATEATVANAPVGNTMTWVVLGAAAAAAAVLILLRLRTPKKPEDDPGNPEALK